MKRLSLSLLCSIGLISAVGCSSKDKTTTDPSAAAEGQEAGAGKAEANIPNRASASTSTQTGNAKTGGRIKTFEAPEPPRTATVVPGSLTGPSNLTVGEVRPTMASKGSQVEIYGSGFGGKVEDIKVMNGRSPWEVIEVFDDRIVVAVGSGMGEGSVNVTVGKGSGATTNSFRPLGGDDSFEAASSDLHGLIGSVYKLDSESIPDFSSAGDPLGTIGLSSLAISSSTASDFEMGLEDFAIRFTGSLNVTTEGEYELCLETDDSSRLLIMDTLVVDNTGGQTDGCELVYLEVGEYDLAVEYINLSATPSPKLILAWSQDGGNKVAIPSEALYRP
jgi:hypothetical protein